MTENLILTRRPGGFEIVDLLDGSKTAIQRAEDRVGVKNEPETTALLEATEINLDIALEPFYTAEKVYLRGDVAVALAPDFKNRPNQNFVVGYNLHTHEGLRNLLLGKGISFEEQHYSQCDGGGDGCFSQSGLLRDRGYAIFTVRDNKRLVDGLYTEHRSFYSQGWLYEDSGVLLSLGPLFLIDIGIGGWGKVPQPLLKLKVPQEYLPANLQQLEVAHQAREDEAKARAAVIFWIVIGAAALIVSGGVIWEVRRLRDAL